MNNSELHLNWTRDLFSFHCRNHQAWPAQAFLPLRRPEAIWHAMPCYNWILQRTISSRIDAFLIDSQCML
jgi:hypothetical protein